MMLTAYIKGTYHSEVLYSVEKRKKKKEKPVPVSLLADDNLVMVKHTNPMSWASSLVPARFSLRHHRLSRLKP